VDISGCTTAINDDQQAALHFCHALHLLSCSAMRRAHARSSGDFVKYFNGNCVTRRPAPACSARLDREGALVILDCAPFD